MINFVAQCQVAEVGEGDGGGDDGGGDGGGPLSLVAVGCKGEHAGAGNNRFVSVGHPGGGFRGNVVVPNTDVASRGVDGGEEAQLKLRFRGDDGLPLQEGLSHAQCVRCMGRRRPW